MISEQDQKVLDIVARQGIIQDVSKEMGVSKQRAGQLVRRAWSRSILALSRNGDQVDTGGKLGTSIMALNLSTRAQNSLNKAGLHTVMDVVSKPAPYLSGLDGMGPTTLVEIIVKVFFPFGGKLIHAAPTIVAKLEEEEFIIVESDGTLRDKSGGLKLVQ